eukprot:GHVN01037553.1.p1 GENE.GHVN01037553.1~~GHVN01037553.1.p1  ORF type:complete len:608 (-),score=52.00 GHVN01037553.1:119-1942(-)
MSASPYLFLFLVDWVSVDEEGQLVSECKVEQRQLLESSNTSDNSGGQEADGTSAIGPSMEDVQHSKNTEVIEFSWTMYNVQAKQPSPVVRRLVRPREISLSQAVGQQLGFTNIEEAKDLQDIVNEFDAACLRRKDESGAPVGVVVFNAEKLEGTFLKDMKSKNLEVANHFNHALSFKDVVSRQYPQITDEEINSAEKIAVKLHCPFSPPASGNLTAESVVTAMSSVITRMTEDDVKLYPSEKMGQGDQKGQGILSPNVLRLRGLPWEAMDKDIVAFIEPIETISEANVHRVIDYSGRSTGEAFVEMSNQEIRDEAVTKLHQKHVGKRWIEVFKSTPQEASRAFQNVAYGHQQQGVAYQGHYAPMGYGMMGGYSGYVGYDQQPMGYSTVLRIRGIPWSTTTSDIAQFFRLGGFTVDPNDVVLGLTPNKKLTGDAWVQMASPQDAEAARSKLHKQEMGRRYVEIFQSCIEHMEMARNWVDPHAMGHGGYGYMVQQGYAQSGGRYSSPYPPNLPRFSVPPGTTVLKMRGLPYHAGESHILEFFRDYPVTIMLIPKAPAGSRPKGEAYVEFGSAEAASIALRQRNGASMDQRYIELFPSSMSEAKEAAGSR